MRDPEKIVVFQIGSLGDTVISVPCYREILRRHPGSKRFLLTNLPIGRKMVQAEALLGPGGLIDGSIEYPMPLRGRDNIARLFHTLRDLRADILYYLTPEKRISNLLRHTAFFRLCGIRSIRGVPWSRDLRFPRNLIPGTLWESEASRLLRTIGAQTEPAAPDPSDRSLSITPQENQTANHLIASVPSMDRFLAISVGGKVPVNNWGDGNWKAALAAISARMPGLGAVFVGSADERDRNTELAAAWAGPVLNSCGQLSPRETAALLARAHLFLGHDTGTLHLAAAVATPILGIYSARNVPGKWYSDRPRDRFLYNQPPCFGCEIERPEACPYEVRCMTSHHVESVVNAALEALARA